MWNEIEESLKTLSFRSFKRELKAHFLWSKMNCIIEFCQIMHFILHYVMSE